MKQFCYKKTIWAKIKEYILNFVTLNVCLYFHLYTRQRRLLTPVRHSLEFWVVRGAVRIGGPSLWIPKRVIWVSGVLPVWCILWKIGDLSQTVLFVSVRYSVSRSYRSVSWFSKWVWSLFQIAVSSQIICFFFCAKCYFLILSWSCFHFHLKINRLQAHQQRISKVPHHGTNIHRVAPAGAALSSLPWWVLLDGCLIVQL